VRRFAVLLTLAFLALAGACTKKKETPANLNAENHVAPRTVRLYYQGPSMMLMAEPRNVEVPQNPAGAMSAVVRELFKGNVNPGLARVFPSDTIVRGAWLLPDGTAFVDLGGATLTNGWPSGSHEELLAVYSVVQTITANFPEAKKVRILINDSPAETLAGHVALDKALVPNGAFVDPRAR
jgi:hypothetical protein